MTGWCRIPKQKVVGSSPITRSTYFSRNHSANYSRQRIPVEVENSENLPALQNWPTCFGRSQYSSMRSLACSWSSKPRIGASLDISCRQMPRGFFTLRQIQTRDLLLLC